ncbi:MAG: DNA-protecting protein DprA [Thermomicrobiales bacterium]|nr:DNA-protecting protein DprA [Thermomicrobiales bacterium]
MSIESSSFEERQALVALSQVSHIGPVRLGRLRDHFGSLDLAWEAAAGDLRGVLDERACREVLLARERISPAEVMERIAKSGAEVITVLDDVYPRILREIPGPPPVLYVRGMLPLQDEPTVAIVGTRRATSYGREAATRIASELAAAGVTIVSGLAKGIDGFAHRAALESAGRTVAVMASGVDIIYPPEHRQLAERIVESGALVSDYPPGAKPDAPNFPARNRIISGLSLATIVIEAPSRSGALITVGFAADQGRDVYAVPGSILSAASEGSNRLLRQGAIPLTSAADLLEDLKLAPSVVEEPEQIAFPMTDDERSLYALVTSEPQHIDELAYGAGFTIAAASALLTMLELKGLVINAGAQHYMATSVRPRSRAGRST